MEQPNLADMTVSEIMRRWPETLGVFLELHMHCVGCPIGVLHTPCDAATEHGMQCEQLLADLNAAIAGKWSRAARSDDPRRSRRAGAAHG